MTENQNGDNGTQERPPDISLAEYGKRDDITALARRVKALMPGGERMTDTEAMSLAQYAVMADANPFRGEVYGFNSRGKFQLVEGYKLLIRWAKRQMPYSEKYEPMPEEELPKGCIGFKCWILREDQRQTLMDMVKAGAGFQQAFEIAASSAVGVVTLDDMTTRDGKLSPPPKGWTWQQVAQKRALKNALNISHGAPSPREIASETWKVGDVETRVVDWIADANAGMSQDERERLAATNATARDVETTVADLTPEERAALLEDNKALLHGEDEIIL